MSLEWDFLLCDQLTNAVPRSLLLLFLTFFLFSSAIQCAAKILSTMFTHDAAWLGVKGVSLNEWYASFCTGAG